MYYKCDESKETQPGYCPANLFHRGLQFQTDSLPLISGK